MPKIGVSPPPRSDGGARRDCCKIGAIRVRGLYNHLNSLPEQPVENLPDDTFAFLLTRTGENSDHDWKLLPESRT
jgi:hypothetical protein